MSQDRPEFFGLGAPPASAAIIGPLAGWVRDAGTLTTRLWADADQVSVGTAVAGRKLTILTTGANQGIRTWSTAATDNVLDALTAIEAFPRLSILADGTISVGDSVAAPDTSLFRGAANRWSCGLNDSMEVAGTGVLAVRAALADANPTAVLDSTRLRLGATSAAALPWSLTASATAGRADLGLDNNVNASGTGSFSVRTAIADAFPNATLSASTWTLGVAGGAAAPDVRGYRSGPLEFTLDDGAAGPVSAIVLGTLDVLKNSAATNTTVDILTVTSKSTGTPLAGFGPRFRAKAEITDGNDLELGGLSWSWNSLAVGAETSVMRLQTRSSAAVIDRWELSNLELYPYADAGQNLGKTSRRINNVVALHYQYSSAGWANPTTDLSNKYLAFGPGGATALNWRILWTANSVAQIDNAAGGAQTLNVFGKLSTQKRCVQTITTAAALYVVTDTDDVILYDAGAVGGTIQLPVPTGTNTGRRITFKRTTAGAGVATIDATTAGVFFIDGLGTATLAAGTLQSMTIVSDGTAAWWII